MNFVDMTERVDDGPRESHAELVAHGKYREGKVCKEGDSLDRPLETRLARAAASTRPCAAATTPNATP